MRVEKETQKVAEDILNLEVLAERFIIEPVIEEVVMGVDLDEEENVQKAFKVIQTVILAGPDAGVKVGDKVVLDNYNAGVPVMLGQKGYLCYRKSNVLGIYRG